MANLFAFCFHSSAMIKLESVASSHRYVGLLRISAVFVSYK